MDFSALNTKAAAEAGAFLHLRNPYNGELMFTENGEPIGVNVRGTEGETSMKAMRRTQKATFIGDDEVKGRTWVSALIIDFVNVTYKGRLLKDTDADKALFLDLSGSFVDQVVDFAKERASFFGNASAA